MDQLIEKPDFVVEGAPVWVRVYKDYSNPNDYGYAAAYIESIPKGRQSVSLIYEYANEEGPREAGYDFQLERSLEAETSVDLIDLRYINQAEVSCLQRNRFYEDETFTYCGPTQISINPYYLFKSDFNEQKKNYYYNYAQETIFVQNHLEPHIYSVVASILHPVSCVIEQYT